MFSIALRDPNSHPKSGMLKQGIALAAPRNGVGKRSIANIFLPQQQGQPLTIPRSRVEQEQKNDEADRMKGRVHFLSELISKYQKIIVTGYYIIGIQMQKPIEYKS